MLPPGLPVHLHTSAGTLDGNSADHADQSRGSATQAERCLELQLNAILKKHQRRVAAEFQFRGRNWEAVFSSSEDRIRASGVAVGIPGTSIVSRDCSSPALSTWPRRAAESLFSILFPSDCRLCGMPLLNISRLPVCPECVASIHPIIGRVCSICSERVLSSYAQCDDDGLLRCPSCRRIDHAFHRAMAYGSYEGALRELIHLLKYDGVRPAANVLGRMLAETLTCLEPSLGNATVLLVPVPLSKTKSRQRGFNQAELIARVAFKTHASCGRFQFASDVLMRVRETHSQMGLTSHQRRENLRGAFIVVRPQDVTGCEVVMVDDVYTTGTTVSECARVLMRAGASRVWVATVARTLKMASKYEEKQGFNILESRVFKDETTGSEAERQLEPTEP
jgi:ComF family protein